MLKPKQKLYIKDKIDYLFFVGNVLIFLGCAITTILFVKKAKINRDWYFLLPTMICNFFSFLFVGCFLFKKTKIILYQTFHFQKKWLYFYMLGVTLYLFAFLFDSIFCMIAKSNIKSNWSEKTIQICLAVYVVLVMLLTSLAIFFQRFAQGKIDYEIEQKRHGKSKVDDQL